MGGEVVGSRSTDTLIIGGGVAGLMTALKLCRHHRVTLVIKSHVSNSSSYSAQGGIASVLSDQDSCASHRDDTLTAGDGLCHEDVVRMVVEEGPQAIQELVDYGVAFSRSHDGQIHLAREAGHRWRRVWHVSDQTGPAIVDALMQEVRATDSIEILTDYVAFDLVTTDMVDPCFSSHRCLGAYVLDARTSEVMVFYARQTVLCTGGHGRIYLYSSNPPSATGDGVAMAWRARARIANLEFMQFHPTLLYHPLKKNMLISEALRGEGGQIVSADGREFISHSLSLRDVLCREIYNELKRSGQNHVCLDVSRVDVSKWQSHFVQIAAVCDELGIPIREGRSIPVVPCAHYSCGGVVVDPDGRTSVMGLYAVGEVSCTGLHGGNRLASNSLLEAVIFGSRVARAIKESPLVELRDDCDDEHVHIHSTGGCSVGGDEKTVLNHTWDEIRRIMWNYVGIVRSTQRLKRALWKITAIQTELDEYSAQNPLSSELCEVKNMACVASLTVLCALKRRESRGCHYTTDYPNPRPRAIDTVL